MTNMFEQFFNGLRRAARAFADSVRSLIFQWEVYRFNRRDQPSAYTEMLWPAQRYLYSKIDLAFSNLQTVTFLLGQRSGKDTFISQWVKQKVQEQFSTFLVVYVATTREQAAHQRSTYEDEDPNVIFKAMSYTELLEMLAFPDKTLELFPHHQDYVIILSEFAWYNRIEFLYNLIKSRRLYNCILQGSGGPYQFRPSDKGNDFYKAATWDVNPTMSRKRLESQFRLDDEKAHRDFGAPLL